MGQAINRTISMSEAYALAEILDEYSRLGIGQVDTLADMVRMDSLYELKNGQLLPSPIESSQEAQEIILRVERILGYPYGASYGISHEFIHIDALRSWEVKKILDQAIANHRNPNPEFRGVNYDGLFMRYTQDPMPEVKISGSEDAAELTLTLSKEQFESVLRAIDLIVGLMSGNFSGITDLAKNDYLIPFVRTKAHRRPSASEQQIKELDQAMKDMELLLGYTESFELTEMTLPRYYQSALSLQKKVRGSEAHPGA